MLRGEPPPKDRITKGVAKLSFSWEALDVKFWERQEGLKDALHALTQTIEISQELTGQPHDIESIIVQEYCPHDLELRVYVVDGNVEGLIYTKFCKIKENNEFGEFKQLFSRTEAAKQWVGGDQAALEDGERLCRELTAHWLVWCQAQLCEMPPAIRFDYFVGRTGVAGKAFVWTLEICELGFSMLGDKKLPQKVFAAMLKSCLSGNLAIDSQSAPHSGSEESPLRAGGALTASQKKRRRKKAGKAGDPADAEAAGDAGGEDGDEGDAPEAAPAAEPPAKP